MQADPFTVAVIGAGAAGTLAAIHLAASARRSGPVRIVAIDPCPDVGRGVAYSTGDRRHLLNIPAGSMSALPDRDDHFLCWLRRNGFEVTAASFVPRSAFGAYLADTLAETVAVSPAARLARRRTRVVGCRPAGGRVSLRLADGGEQRADAVVLATGMAGPSVDWAPPTLRSSARFVDDPWLPDALDAVRRDITGDVLLVGTGLTMVDVALALGRPDRTLHAVSRRGLLPRAHADHQRPPVAFDLRRSGRRLDELRRAVAAHLTATVRTCGDWRPAMDGLRAVTSAAWAGLSAADRAEFLEHDSTVWGVLRHRMPPESAATIGAMRQNRRLRVSAGRVSAIDEDGDDLVATLSNGETLRVRWVVNCTGPRSDVAQQGEPLFDDLIARGLARPGPLGLGLETLDGRLVAADGSALGPVWALGALRRGELWETTGVPEIRAQAAQVAADLLATRAAATGRPSSASRPAPRDPLGLRLSTSAAAAAAYDAGLGRVMRLQAGAEEDFRRATELDPGFAAAHAALALLGHESGAPVDVAGSLAAAQAAVRRRGDDRERSLVEVVTQRVHDCHGAGADALRRHVTRHPRDVLAVSAAVPTVAFSGATDIQQEAWALVEGLAPAYGDHWWHESLLAFVRQDQGRYDEAAALAGRALATEPASGHAVHAQTHVFYETGSHEAGLHWLDGWIDSCGRVASHRAHFSWHAALHELTLGDAEGVCRRYAAQLAPMHVRGVRALVDSASLLWRCRLTGTWPGCVPVDEVVAAVEPGLLECPETPFIAMHAALALAGVGDAAALQRLGRHASDGRGEVMRCVVATLCDALRAVVEQRWPEAILDLARLGPSLHQVGGSAAQREVVEETLLFALVSAGRCDQARRLLEARLDRRPSPLDRRRVESLPLGAGAGRGNDTSGSVTGGGPGRHRAPLRHRR